MLTSVAYIVPTVAHESHNWTNKRRFFYVMDGCVNHSPRKIPEGTTSHLRGFKGLLLSSWSKTRIGHLQVFCGDYVSPTQ